MIALNPPLPGWLDDDAENVLVLAIDRSVVICANETGHLWVRPIAAVQVDVRYDAAADGWWIGGSLAEEETDDGGAEVSGRLPDPDGERDGHPGDERD